MRYHELKCGHIIDLDRITFIKCCDDGRHLVGYSDKDAPAIVLDDEEYNGIRALLLDLPAETEDPATRREMAEYAAMMAVQVTDLGLTVRTINILHAMDIHTLAGLCAHKKKDIMRSRGIGRKGMSELDRVLEERGLDFGDRRAEKHVPRKTMEIYREDKYRHWWRDSH